MDIRHRYLIRFSKKDDLIYISHLDFMRLLARAIRRSRLPAAYSDGFSPHMKMSFPYALPLFVEAENEVFILELSEKISPQTVLDLLESQCPSGLTINEVVSWQGSFPEEPHRYQVFFTQKSRNFWEETMEKVQEGNLAEFSGKITSYTIKDNILEFTAPAPVNPFKMAAAAGEEMKKSIERIVKK